MKKYKVTVVYYTDGWGSSRFYESNIEAISKVDALGRAVNDLIEHQCKRVIELSYIQVERLRSSQTPQLDELVGPEDFDEDITTTSGRTSSGILYNKTTALTYQTYKFVVKRFHDATAEVYTDQIVIHDCYSQFQAEAKLAAQMKHTKGEGQWWIDTVEILEDMRINK